VEEEKVSKCLGREGRVSEQEVELVETVIGIVFHPNQRLIFFHFARGERGQQADET
jgi:hypothetical protein